MIKILGCHSWVTQPSSALPLTVYIITSNRKTKDIVLISVPSFDTIWCELKKKKKSKGTSASQTENIQMSRVLRHEGHSSLLTILPLHTILENYFGIAFKAICILSVLSKFSLIFFLKTGIWCQIRVKTDKFVNTLSNKVRTQS